MRPPVRVVRVSVVARGQLIWLKRATHIDQWNVLCRWALCRSLADPTLPAALHDDEMSNIEMSWPVFAGPMGDLLVLLLRQRCLEDKLDIREDRVVAEQLQRHLHRGIAHLAAHGVGIRSIEALVGMALDSSEPIRG